MLLALMAGEDVPKSVTLPTELVIRQSCGCQPREESRAIDPSTIQTGETFEAVIAANRALILSDMAKTAAFRLPAWDPAGPNGCSRLSPLH